MKLSGKYTLPIPRERAYEALQDPALLSKCILGCESLEPIGDDTYRMKMKMILAAMNGVFEGKVKISEPNKPESFKLVVEGTGKIGFMKGGGLLRLAEAGETTDVQYEGDVTVGGTIAAVGSRLIDTTAKMMIKKFFEKFSELTKAS